MTARRLAIPPLVAFVLLVAGCGGGADKPHGGGGPTGAGSGTAATTPAPRRVARLVPPAGAPVRTVRVPVLTYHRVARLRPGANAIEADLTVEPATFVASMRGLRAAGFHTVSQEQVFDALWRGRPLPSRPVLLTVDDGYVDDVTRILPVLRRERMVATFFVITGRLHEPGFLSAGQVRALDRAGMDVGDHTRSHVDLTLIPAAQVTEQTAGSRRTLQRVLGHSVYTLAYPYGRHDPAVEAAVRRAGFTMAYTTAFGTSLSTASPLTMPRLHVGRAVSPAGVVGLAGS